MFGAPKKAPPTPKELVKQNRRQVTKSQHEIQREIYALEIQEKQTLMEIKKLAAKGQNSSVRVLAKQVVTIRAQKERLQKSHAHLNGLKTAGSTMAANLAMSQAMAGTAHVMSAVNANMSAESMSAAMQEMEKNMALTEMQEDMLDDLLDDSDEEMEADDIMGQVMDEIGLDLKSEMVSAPTRGVKVNTGASKMGAERASSSSHAADFEPLSAQEEAEAEQLLAELGV